MINKNPPHEQKPAEALFWDKAGGRKQNHPMLLLNGKQQNSTTVEMLGC